MPPNLAAAEASEKLYLRVVHSLSCWTVADYNLVVAGYISTTVAAVAAGCILTTVVVVVVAAAVVEMR